MYSFATIVVKLNVYNLLKYSVGKTSMIKFLLNGVEYPGSMIGPEPTTDCFTVIYHSANATTVMGTSLASDNTLPFQVYPFD